MGWRFWKITALRWNKIKCIFIVLLGPGSLHISWEVLVDEFSNLKFFEESGLQWINSGSLSKIYSELDIRHFRRKGLPKQG